MFINNNSTSSIQNYELFLSPHIFTGTKYQKSKIKETSQSAERARIKYEKNKTRLNQSHQDFICTVFSNFKLIFQFNCRKLYSYLLNKTEWKNNLEVIKELNTKLSSIDNDIKTSSDLNKIKLDLEELNKIEKINIKFLKGHCDPKERLDFKISP